MENIKIGDIIEYWYKYNDHPDFNQFGLVEKINKTTISVRVLFKKTHGDSHVLYPTHYYSKIIFDKIRKHHIYLNLVTQKISDLTIENDDDCDDDDIYIYKSTENIFNDTQI